MRHIDKQDEPECFTRWKTVFPNAQYKDLGRDRLFPGAQQARWELRKSLLSEQKGLCCYCEARIDNGDFHIEHFRPKNSPIFTHLQLDYSNLHASCGKIKSGDDSHCGHKKDDSFSTQLISPLEQNCDTHFMYNLSGKIIGVDIRGNETISILNLNSSLLTKSRKLLIEDFEDMEDEEYDKEVTIHLDPNANLLGEFYSAIKYLHTAKLLH